MAESRAKRSAAAKKGWATRRARGRRRNPETESKRRSVARSAPRNKLGQFVKRGGSHKSGTHRRNAESFAKRSRAAKLGWRRRRANPGGGIMDTLIGGATGALVITGSRAATRIVPGLAKLPTTGPKGIAVQTGTALALALAGHFALGQEWGERILAGALTAPLEDAIAEAKVPYLAPALSGYPMVPVVTPHMLAAGSGGGVGGYASETLAQLEGWG